MYSFITQNEFSPFLDLLKNQKKDLSPKKNNSGNSFLSTNSSIQSILNYLPSAIFIIDYHTGRFDYISNGASDIAGYALDNLYKKSLEKAWEEMVHPKDKQQTLNKTYQKMTAFIKTLSLDELKNFQFSFNYRILRRDGTYMKVIQQKVFIEDASKENQLYSVNVITDISAHKKDNSCVFEISRYNSKKGNEIISSEIFFHDDLYPGISKREHEVIEHIISNKTSKEIGEILFISDFTVKAHRRNILKKLNCNNSNDLRNYVLINGYK